MGTGVEEVVAAPIIDEVIGAELFGGAAEAAGAGAGAAAAETAAAETAAAAAAPSVAEAAAPGMVDVMGGTEAAMASSPAVAAAAPDMTSVLAEQISQTPYGRNVPYTSLDQYAAAQTATDATTQPEWYEKLGYGTPVTPGTEAVPGEFNLEDFLNKYGKYGALGGQALLGGLQARGLAKQAGKLRSELGDLPGAKQALATGQQMVSGAQAGQLLPGQEAAINQFRSDKMAQLESYLQRAGIRDSSSAAALRNQVENQVQNYRQTLLQANLNQGMQLMGVSDAATAAAIRAGYGANADAANLAQRYAAAAAFPLSGVYGPLTPGR